jgi:hypothetical protein
VEHLPASRRRLFPPALCNPAGVRSEGPERNTTVRFGLLRLSETKGLRHLSSQKTQQNGYFVVFATWLAADTGGASLELQGSCDGFGNKERRRHRA